jgi:type I restriction enzyme M protein
MATSYKPLTLAHFGFDKDGGILPDAELPTTLTADWQADADNADRPFPSYARLLDRRGTPEGESRYSWTLDFAARRAEARARMQPLQRRLARCRALVVELKERLKRAKKTDPRADRLAALESRIRRWEKAARDLEARIADIDAAVFDLKAVNPNALAKGDARTPEAILDSIERQGRLVAESLATLRAWLANQG